VSRYPSSDIDLAFVLPDEVPAGELEAVLAAAAGELSESVRLLDVYRGQAVAPGARSLAYRIRFCALDRTLTDADVAELRTACIEAVEGALPATLRS
jgi:phenylalanyl-tRNA synthetase beta chain